MRKTCSKKKKRFQDVTTKPTTDKHINSWPTTLFEKKYFPFETKKGLVRFELRIFSVPGIFVTYQAKLAADFIMNKDTSDSVKQIVNQKKVYIQVL